MRSKKIEGLNIVKKDIVSYVFLCVLFLAAFAASAYGGVIITRQSYRVVGGGKGTQILGTWREYYQDNKVAVYQGNAAFIIDIDNSTLTNIILSRSIYAVNTVQDFVDRINRIVKQIKAQPMFEGNDKACKSVKILVKKTDKEKKILGYAAWRYDVYANGEKKREAWVGRIPPLLKEVDFNKAMALKFKIENILAPLSGCKDIDSNPRYRKLFVDGNVPMVIVDYLTGRVEGERITNIQVTPISQKVFAVPKGFKKVPIEKFMVH